MLFQLLGGVIVISVAFFFASFGALLWLGLGLLIMFVGVYSGRIWSDFLEAIALSLLFLGISFQDAILCLSSLALAVFVVGLYALILRNMNESSPTNSSIY